MAAPTDKTEYPANEAERLKALHQAHILGTLPEEAFDGLARLAAQICGVPIAGVSLVDAECQWFKSILGIDLRGTPRGAAFCSHTILQTEVMIVPDAAADERFAQNPLVTGEPNIRFYAGAPLITPEGYALGSLCVIDRVPRSLTEDQICGLQILARQAASQIELTRRVAEQAQDMAEREAAQEEVRRSESRLAEAQRVAQIGSWEYDVDTGKITWSAEMFRILGFDPAQSEPDYAAMMKHYHPDDNAAHDAAVMQALDDGLPYEFEIRILPAEGVMRWGHVRGQAARDESGRIIRLFGMVMDITERWRTEAENARLAAIIESSQDAVLGLTLDGTLVSWNAGAERLYGYHESEIIGQPASLLAPPEQRGHIAGVIRALQRGEAQKNWELHFRQADGTASDTVLTFSPIRSPLGEVIGAAAIGRDVTEQRRAEEAVRRSEARLAEAQRVAHIGSWELDAQTHALVFSEQMYALFELDPALSPPPHAEVLTRYHPDDVEAHTALVGRSLADRQPFTTDMRIVRKSGEVRWVHIIGEPVLDEQGTLLRFVGTMMDITERILVEQRFRVLFEYSPEAHFLVGAGGIADCNQAALEILRCGSKAELAAIHPRQLSPEYQADGRRSSEKGVEMEAQAYKNGSHQFEWIHTRLDGEEFPTQIILTPVTLDGSPAMLSVWHDLTERKRVEQQIRDYAVILEFQKQELEQANRELCDLATTDGLTGLKNHRAFQERLQSDIESAERHRTPLSLILLDVDHFKQFNDTFGHPAGDAVLRQVAHTLEQTTRDCDFVARYGGEEFIVVLPQTDADGAVRAAERCRLALEAAEWSFRPVTASFGVSTLSITCADGAALVDAADRALYAAKFHGRNRVMDAGTLCLPS